MLRAISLPLVGDLFYRPWLNKKIGITKHLFYRPPPVLEQLLPEMNRMKALPGARVAVLRSIHSNIYFKGVRKEAYILERLRGSPVHLLTVWGAKDGVMPIEYADDVRRELPDSIVRVIQECGPCPQMEKPELFNLMLVSFLKDGSVPAAQDKS